MIATKAKIGPRHHGRKMSLRAFEFAQAQEGCHCELARGYIVVSDVPNFPHMRQASYIRSQLDYFRVVNPALIYEVLTGLECKLLITSGKASGTPTSPST